jgi:hypothetical protein
MVLPAAERATQVPTASISPVGQKANPTVRTACDAVLKFGMGSQGRVQRGLVLPDKRLGAIVLMPIGTKLENRLNGDDKKARFSAIIEILLVTSSSYPIEANTSRGRARFFSALATELGANSQHERSMPFRPPRPFLLPQRRRTAARHILKSLLGKKKTSSSFQVDQFN